jgi:hypothetical protein
MRCNTGTVTSADEPELLKNVLNANRYDKRCKETNAKHQYSQNNDYVALTTDNSPYSVGCQLRNDSSNAIINVFT